MTSHTANRPPRALRAEPGPRGDAARGRTVAAGGAVSEPVAAADIRFTITRTWIGLVLVARGAGGTDGVCAVMLGDDRAALRRELQDRFPESRLVDDDGSLDRVASRVVRSIESPAKALDILSDVPLDMRGTAFQQKVWRALQAIPPGSTETYAGLAARIGMPNAARAVAGACAANPLAVVVPCHRVVRRDGQLSGYRWGVERKRALLDREAGT